MNALQEISTLIISSLTLHTHTFTHLIDAFADTRKPAFDAVKHHAAGNRVAHAVLCKQMQSRDPRGRGASELVSQKHLHRDRHMCLNTDGLKRVAEKACVCDSVILDTALVSSSPPSTCTPSLHTKAKFSTVSAIQAVAAKGRCMGPSRCACMGPSHQSCHCHETGRKRPESSKLHLPPRSDLPRA